MPTAADRDALIASAQRIGADPLDLATVMSFESGFSPSIRGGSGNRHIGLIQFGPTEQQQYGASQDQSFADQLPAVERYLTDRGFKPGMGMLDLYSTVNAGRPGLYDRSDTANGGTPGTVADKVNGQMAGHRAKAAAFLGGAFSPGSAAPRGAFGLSGPVAAGTDGSVTPAGGAAMQSPEADRTLQVASLLRTLTAADAPAASPVAQAAAAPAQAPVQMQPARRQAPAFDAQRFFALLPGTKTR
ncbi:hypothetical protein ABID82_002362 [Methylobacterium sp. PvP062]|uniref:Transglycosylase SLT domain-containing protein n=1 Tax=Methylobacterium radiotolerans TaxID=31998 RepID=A0ABV2NN82_9HYPH|nr:MULTISPECIES: hypothetical protein [unclassified Methylobacterium]MBP2495306.1 hypothetical protein [Methylobacterium sp. PvP105]MBP2504823.1 hypothetical protein [Methylobacterium sp. PvP109]MCX7335830.1 hypothetical protein [Hyphomicrobiales bacterium]